MSHFTDTLAALLRLEGKTQQVLSDESGVEQSLISRMLRGKIPSREQLAGLVAAISSDRSRRLELLLAHLRDEAESVHSRAGLDERHYILAPTSEDSPDTIKAPGTLGAELQLIADECAHYPEMRAVVTDLSHLLLRHRAERADATLVKLYPFSGDAAPLAADPTPADQALAEEKARRAERKDSKSAS